MTLPGSGRIPFVSRSIWRKVLVTSITAVGFVLLYEATIWDSRTAREAAIHDPTKALMAGSRLDFNVTAYCKGTTTSSGVGVRSGIAAADPTLLPVGSVVSVGTNDAKYNGVYTIMDTGPKVQGRILDLYMWSCNEALQFGRKDAQITVLRLGWDPRASTQPIVDSLFRRRENARTTAEQAPKPVDSGDFDSSPPTSVPEANVPRLDVPPDSR